MGLGAGGASPVSCTDDDGCVDDTYCGPEHVCTPWTAAHPSDPTCVHLVPAGVLQPVLRCELTSVPAGDPFPGNLEVLATPLVARFRAAGDPGPPSIVAVFGAEPTSSDADRTLDEGVIRVLRGDDCTVEAVLGDGKPWFVSGGTPAIGDLDGDGIPEILAPGVDGSLVAFTKKNGAWTRLWTSAAVGTSCATPSGCTIALEGVAIHDLDGDGVPEVLREGAVVSGKDGSLRAAAPPDFAHPAPTATDPMPPPYGWGLFSVVEDLDGDGIVDLTDGAHVWTWTNPGWLETTFVPATPSPPPPSSVLPAGHVALADFGAYGLNVPAESLETVVVRDNQVMIYARDGSFVMPPQDLPQTQVAAPFGPFGGPPVIADFDGDGLPEVGVAGQYYFTVFDLDCGPAPRPGGTCTRGPCALFDQTCLSGPDGYAYAYVSWSGASFDTSSQSYNGASAFDFEGDGRAEAIVTDQCFVRAYDGAGSVLFSQYRSSCTAVENAVVADADGDFRADLIVPSQQNLGCSSVCTQALGVLDANGVDARFAGLRCVTGADCVSGACDAGLCRCTDSAGCCPAGDAATCEEQGSQCAPPPAGTPGTGDTCRAGYPHPLSGVRVYADRNDAWTRARPIYNQHTYSVNNVGDDGSIPAKWTPNRASYRQNVSGTAEPRSIGDLTAGATSGAACSAAGATLSAPVCNRGSDPVGPGISVGFYTPEAKVCATTTSSALLPGQCETVSCVWATPPTSIGARVDVSVLPDDDGARAECKTGNDRGTVHDVFCPP